MMSSRRVSTCLLLVGFVAAAWLRFDVGTAAGSWSVALITFGAAAWSWISQARRLPPVELPGGLQELGNRENLDPEEEARFAEGLRAWHAQQQRDAWREIERGGRGPLIAARAVLYFLWAVPFTIVFLPPWALPGTLLAGLPRFLVVLLPLAVAAVAVAAPLGIRDWSRARDALTDEESGPRLA